MTARWKGPLYGGAGVCSDSLVTILGVAGRGGPCAMRSRQPSSCLPVEEGMPAPELQPPSWKTGWKKQTQCNILFCHCMEVHRNEAANSDWLPRVRTTKCYGTAVNRRIFAAFTVFYRCSHMLNIFTVHLHTAWSHGLRCKPMHFRRKYKVKKCSLMCNYSEMHHKHSYLIF